MTEENLGTKKKIILDVFYDVSIGASLDVSTGASEDKISLGDFWHTG